MRVIAAMAYERYLTGEAGATDRLLLTRARGPAASGRPVLLLHGSSLPGSLSFAIRFDGVSCLDDLAARGFDAWTLDIRGYGGSWTPEDDGNRPCTPVADTAQAVADVTTAVDWISRETGAEAVDLVGWSWGATVAAAYAAQGGALGRLVLHAPQWMRDTPSPMVNAQSLNDPYRPVDQALFVERWRGRFSAGAEPAGWADNLTQALAEAPDQPIVVPNGSARDIAVQWMAGAPAYDPADILAPTLVVVGDADVDTPPTLGEAVWERLGSATKRFRTIPAGTHFTVLEPARAALFGEVAAFLQASDDALEPSGAPT